MTVGYTMDIEAGKYTTKWPANAATTTSPWFLASFMLMFSKWTVQCVHLHNIQLNSDSTWLHSHNCIEEIKVDNWMQKIEYILQICMSIFNIFHQFQFYSCYQYYTTYISNATMVFAQAALPKVSVYKCSVHFVYRSTAWCCTGNGQTVWGAGNNLLWQYNTVQLCFHLNLFHRYLKL